MKRCFVACIKKEYESHFLDKSRLYAFPIVPAPISSDEFIIIDSGAFALSQKGKEIDAEYMFRLSRFYKKHGASNQFPVLGIAPDKFLDPFKSMSNYKFWMEYTQLPVVPVIQFSKKKRIDFFEAKKQVDFYMNYGNKIFAVSNPSLTGFEAKIMSHILLYMRQQGAIWIHNLGAGWNTMDCKDWFNIGFDSIDSISYYTDAEKNMAWTPFSYSVRNTNLSPEHLLIANYNLANCSFYEK